MSSDTLGQNSGVNFGKHLRGQNGKLIQKGEPGFVTPMARPFVEQKTIVLPQSLVDEARGAVAKQFSPKVPRRLTKTKNLTENENPDEANLGTTGTVERAGSPSSPETAARELRTAATAIKTAQAGTSEREAQYEALIRKDSWASRQA